MTAYYIAIYPRGKLLYHLVYPYVLCFFLPCELGWETIAPHKFVCVFSSTVSYRSLPIFVPQDVIFLSVELVFRTATILLLLGTKVFLSHVICHTQCSKMKWRANE